MTELRSRENPCKMGHFQATPPLNTRWMGNGLLFLMYALAFSELSLVDGSHTARFSPLV